MTDTFILILKSLYMDGQTGPDGWKRDLEPIRRGIDRLGHPSSARTAKYSTERAIHSTITYSIHDKSPVRYDRQRVLAGEAYR